MAPSCNCKSATISAAWGLLLLCVSFMAEPVSGELVPALYVLGDSQADAGNNNHLVLPPTAQGQLPAQRHRLPGAAGHRQGLAISFDEQIERDYAAVYGGLVRQLGPAQASVHVARSIFTVAIGGNDIAARVLSDQRQMSSDQQLIGSLAQSLKRKLQFSHSSEKQDCASEFQRMYRLGMRRLFFVGTGPLGCYPLLRQRSLATECDAEASSLSVRYRAAAAAILRDMSTRRPGFRYSPFDQYTALLGYIQEPEANGFADAKAACCALGNSTALLICTPENALCADRTSHVFWDGAHLTEATAEKLVAVAFNGSAPLVSPVNLKQLSAP
ncbi:hypothetical protein C2845_PM01G36270 [Panicum miliaceum]|uniref:GDSL esterase/lipase n=1 Tax=Panicum miliaceum TaxID=4540 RepID=A0A3L6THZ8_PANMI|nr:hypothetical protein C2845_PM01G36270 [Panicum miliaceum]